MARFVEKRDAGHESRVWVDVEKAWRVERPRWGEDRVVLHLPGGKVTLRGHEAHRALAVLQNRRADKAPHHARDLEYPKDYRPPLHGLREVGGRVVRMVRRVVG